MEKLQGYTPGFQPAAFDVVKLNTNENPYPPSPYVMEVLRSFDAAALRRYPSPLGQKFRKAAAEINGIDEDNIICTNGGDDLLTIAFRCFCDRSNPVAYPKPTYTLYDELAALQDCEVISVDFANEDLFGQLAACPASMVILCNPNAPTGSFFEPSAVASLAKQLEGKAVLLVDEAYADFAPGNCASLIKEHHNLIILRSLSKGYSLAGLRFGYGIACRQLIDGMLKVKDSYNVDALSIEIAAAAIQDREYFKRNVELVKTQRKRVRSALLEMGFDTPDSHANFLFAAIENPTAEQVYESLKSRNIYVRYFPVEPICNRLRITIGTARENDKLLSALNDIVKGKL